MKTVKIRVCSWNIVECMFYYKGKVLQREGPH